MYYRARFYDTEIGRFLTKDPLTGGPDDPRVCYSTNIYGMHKAEIDRNTSVLNAKLFDIRREIEREKLSQNVKQKENEDYSNYVQRVILASLEKEIELQRKYSGKAIDYLRNKQQLEWGLDPFNTNRYVYVHNNPINYIDPLGLIIVRPKKGTRARAIVDLNLLKLMKSAAARKMLKELHGDKKHFYEIKMTEGKNTILPSSGPNARRKGVGTSGTISFNPKNLPMIATSKGDKKHKPETALAHELFHAWDYSRGLINDKLHPKRQIAIKEARAMEYTNTIRDELKYGYIRIRYHR